MKGLQTVIKFSVSRCSTYASLHAKRRPPQFTGCFVNKSFRRESSETRNLYTTSRCVQTATNEKTDDVSKFPPISDSVGAKQVVRQLTDSEVQLLADSLHEYNETRCDDVTSRQLSAVALGNFIPFIGFGFIDNVIMIFAGDFIDVKIGAYLGITIMAAAAMGNMVADIAGLSLAGYIETFSSKLSFVQANLSTKQQSFKSVKLAKYGGCIVGVMIGCLIGMFPLLFIGNR